MLDADLSFDVQSDQSGGRSPEKLACYFKTDKHSFLSSCERGFVKLWEFPSGRL